MNTASFTFHNKIIYIVSSEYWGTMHVSKHHYALELAALGNKVYYIEPPSLANNGVAVKKSTAGQNLFIVSYKPVMRAKRFLPAFAYNWLTRYQVRLLKKAIGTSPDVVWSFDPFRFGNLRWFRAGISIFHPVDFFTCNEVPGEAKTADICFASSKGIQKEVAKGGRPVFFINHGLNEHFCEGARAALTQIKQEPKQGILQAGYIGNLLMEAPDRATMRTVIEQNNDVHFHFWGQYEKNSGGLATYDSEEVYAFVEFLKQQKNVTLYGPVPFTELYERLKEMDLMWICWHLRKAAMWNEFTNPHKILEYLGTGKPLVAHYMATYEGSPLIDMLTQPDNENYADLFDRVCQRVRAGEPVASQHARIIFALNNSYRKQIERIEQLINESWKPASHHIPDKYQPGKQSALS